MRETSSQKINATVSAFVNEEGNVSNHASPFRRTDAQTDVWGAVNEYNGTQIHGSHTGVI